MHWPLVHQRSQAGQLAHIPAHFYLIVLQNGQAGQSFWSIAIAYKITIQDLETWNNLSRNSGLQIGERLFIPGSNTAGYATPTPVDMVQVSSPDRDGKIVHVVQPYQTLSTIAQAYRIKIDTILRLNGIQVDWPLKIGQKLIINPGNVTPSPTPRPLTPIEKLTPASDGKYYHIVKSGETLSWIARYYQVRMADLMAWNGLNESSILMPDQKLVLEVTPPASVTPTPAPATATRIATTAPPTPTPTLLQTPTAGPSTAPVEASFADGRTQTVWIGLIGLVAGGLLLVVLINRKREN
ncbi:MAG TPA: LysM peptidoglycan-binding domain-containing protein [Anaerolineales bacterium]